MLDKLINPFLSKVIDIEHNEFKKVVLLQLTIFLIISVLMILKPFSTSLMLDAYGLNIMPTAFISIAIAAIIIHYALLLLRQSFSLISATNINFCFHIMVISGMALASYFNFLIGWLTVATYVYISLFSVVTVTLFFQYCQSLLSISEAKRVLSYIGVGAIAGGVFGGYFASALVSNFGNIGLLCSAVVFLLLSALSLNRVHQNFGIDLLEDKANTEWIGGQFFRTLKNKHVAYIVGITFFGVIASKLLDYLFNALVYAHITDREEMTAFFGFWFSTINVIGLAVQLFFVKVIIDRLGVSYSMALMPVMILGSLIVFLYLPVLALGIIMKMVDGSMKQSLYKTSTEINIMPLSSGIRERVKSMVDVVVDSIATGLSGILIFLLINKVSLPFSVIALATIIIVFLWLSFILLSKKTYLRQLSNLVYGNDTNDEDFTVSPKEYLEHMLKGNPLRSARRFNKLFRLTKEAETPIKSAAIETISLEYKDRGLIKLKHLRNDNSIVVRKKFFEEKLKYINSNSDLNNLYKATHPENQIILTGALARSIKTRSRQQEKYKVKKRIDSAYNYLCQNKAPRKLWRTWMTAVAHSKMKKYYPILQENLGLSSNGDMKMYALFAIMRGKLKILYPDVLKCKVTTRNRKRWYKVLATFPNKLMTHINELSENESNQVKKLIPAFKYIDKQSHLDFLFSILEHPNRSLRIQALRTIGVMKRRFSYLKYNRRKNRVRLQKIIFQTKEIHGEMATVKAISEMKNYTAEKSKSIIRAEVILKNELNIHLHILFILLGLVLDTNNMMKCYYGLMRGRKQETLDYLDQLLPYRLKKKLIPVLQYVFNEEVEKVRTPQHKQKINAKDLIIPNLKRLDASLHDELIEMKYNK